MKLSILKFLPFLLLLLLLGWRIWGYVVEKRESTIARRAELLNAANDSTERITKMMSDLTAWLKEKNKPSADVLAKYAAEIESIDSGLEDLLSSADEKEKVLHRELLSRIEQMRTLCDATVSLISRLELIDQEKQDNVPSGTSDKGSNGISQKSNASMRVRILGTLVERHS